MKHERFRILAITIAIALIILSSIGTGARISLGGTVEPETYRAHAFSVAGDTTLEIGVFENSSINFFILSLEESIKLARSQDITNVKPIYSLYNLSTSFEMYIDFLYVGVYSIVVRSTTNTTAAFEIDMLRVFPQYGILIPGMLLLMGTLLVTVIENFRHIADLIGKQ